MSIVVVPPSGDPAPVGCADICTAWTTAEDIAARPGIAALGLAHADLAEAALAGSEILYRLSGYRWPGSCSDTVRPVLCTPHTCGCAWTIRLDGHVTSVVEIREHGETLTEGTDFTVVDNAYLHRRDGSWPCCQSLHLPATEQHTLEVVYTYGTLPDRAGRRAAAAYGAQLAIAAGGGTCSLTAGVSQIVREGVTYVVVDPAETYAKGLTGIGEVDAWLASIAPRHLPFAIRSPDYRPPAKVM